MRKLTARQQHEQGCDGDERSLAHVHVKDPGGSRVSTLSLRETLRFACSHVNRKSPQITRAAVPA